MSIKPNRNNSWHYHHPEKPGAVILAGGIGRRLGRDKTTLQIQGKSILSLITSQLARLDFNETLLVYGNESKSSGLPVQEVYDLIPNCGSLGGIYTGLSYSTSQLCFLMACDMPFPNLALIRHLLYLAESEQHDCVIPRDHGLLEPLFAVYRKTCLPAIKSQIDQGNLKIAGILPSLKTRIVSESELDQFDPQRLSFFNINVPTDIKQVEILLKKSTPES